MTHDSMESEILDYIQLQRKREEYTSILQMRYDLLKSELEALKKPPTVDEVCKALSELLDDNVILFYGDFVATKTNRVVVCKFDNNEILTEISLPPNLITLIGRFYEGLEVEERKEDKQTWL